MNRKPIIKASIVKSIAKFHGRRVSKEFLSALDSYVFKKVTQCCETHNGGKKTLDASIAGYNGIQ